MKSVASRIETARLVVRCWAPEDAEAVKRAEDESRVHLSRFMVWAAKGPETLDEVVAKLRIFRSWYDTNTDYMMGAFDRESGRIVGGCGLHSCAEVGGLEIGTGRTWPASARGSRRRWRRRSRASRSR